MQGGGEPSARVLKKSDSILCVLAVFSWDLYLGSSAEASTCPAAGVGTYILYGASPTNIPPGSLTSTTKVCVTSTHDINVANGTISADGNLVFSTKFFYGISSSQADDDINNILFSNVSVTGAATANTPFLEFVPLSGTSQMAATRVNLVDVNIGQNRSIEASSTSSSAFENPYIYIASTTPRTYENFAITYPELVAIGAYNIDKHERDFVTDLTLKDSSIIGAATVGVRDGSTLRLDNTTIDATYFRLDGTLSGNGTIRGMSGAADANFLTASGSVFAPGNSIGTLAINGDLSFQGATDLVSELNPLASQNADLLDVSGSIGGLNNLTVTLEKDSGYAATGAGEITDFVGATYVVLDAASIDSDGVTLVEGASLNAHLSASLVASPTAAGKVEVQFTDNSAVGTHLPSKILTLSSGKKVTLSSPVAKLTSAISATHTGSTVNGISGGSGGGSQLVTNGSTLSTAWLSLTNSQLLQLNTVHAEPYSSNLTVALEQVDQVASTVMSRISGGHDVLDRAKTTRDSQGRVIWMDSSGTLGHVEGQDGLGTFGYSLVNLIVGADVLASEAGSAGVFAGYGFHQMSEHDNVDQSFSAHTGYGGAYLTLLPGDWRLALSGGYAYSANSGMRNNPDVGLFTGGRAESDFNSHSAFVAGKFGYAASVTEILSVTPFVSASYSRIWQGEAKETGGGDFSYDVHAATAEAIVTGVGLDWTADIVNVERSKAQLGGFLRYDHDWSAASDSSHDVTVTNSLFGTFTQSGQNRGPHTLTGGFGVMGALSERAAWRVGLAGSMSPHGHEIGAGGHFTLYF
ncbi:autotransporter outer membrane beta-barrel domain-containing protein [Roseibium sp.]|uniref:autotransporter family protein n=1 Tax=Roseibium sp. TaxID=1936156 RepID=UPI003A978269